MILSPFIQRGIYLKIHFRSLPDVPHVITLPPLMLHTRLERMKVLQ